jgi:predicted kinase
MAEVIVLRGLPGSGKSTWAENYLIENPDAVRVSRDDIRVMIRASDWPGVEFEDLVTQIEHKTITAAVAADRTVIVDAMHLRPQYIRNLYKLVPWDVPFRFMEFDTDVDTCVFRDAVRGRTGRMVGEHTIRNIAARYLQRGKFPPVPEREYAAGKPVLRPWTPPTPDAPLPDAIIVDIDGTLAHMADRSPYDPTLYHTDTLDTVVAELVQLYRKAGVHAIVVSGRTGTPEARTTTEEWLASSGVKYDQFYMRADGDDRKDDVVKDEIFETHIAGKYNILFTLDDRQRVVDMWRAKGI